MCKDSYLGDTLIVIVVAIRMTLSEASHLNGAFVQTFQIFSRSHAAYGGWLIVVQINLKEIKRSKLIRPWGISLHSSHHPAYEELGSKH